MTRTGLSSVAAAFPLRSLVVLMLCGLASPQTPFDGGSRTPLDWKPGVVDPAQGLSTALAADLTGDLHPDLVLVNGTRAVLVYGPAAHRSMVAFPQELRDAALLRARGPKGQDSLLLAGTAGLQHTWFDAPSRAFVAVPVATSPAWLAAQRLEVLEDVGAGPVAVAGVTSDGATVVILRDALGAGSPGPTLAPGGLVLDLCALDWTGDAARELVVATSQGVFVYADTGLPLGALPMALEKAHLTRVRQQGSLHDRLAAVVRGVGQSQDLLVVKDFQVHEPHLVITAHDVRGLAAGDLDGDGDDDLVLNNASSAALTYLANESDGAPAGLGATFPAPPEEIDVGHGSGPAPMRSGEPVLVDADRDGDLDLCVALSEHAETVLVRSRSEYEEQRSLSALPSVYTNPPFDIGSLALELALPPDPLAGATHLEVVAWRQPDLASKVSSVAVSRDLHDLQAGPTQTVPVSIPEAEMYTPAVYYLQVRQVVLDVAGAAVDAGPGKTYAFTTDEATAAALSSAAQAPPVKLILVDGGDDDSELGSGIQDMRHPDDYDQDPPAPDGGT